MEAIPPAIKTEKTQDGEKETAFPSRESGLGDYDTSNWFMRRINWLGSSSVPRSASSA